jgi:hypothetical protein
MEKTDSTPCQEHGWIDTRPHGATYRKGKTITLGLQVVEAPRISRQSAHESGKAFSPTHRPPLPPRRYPWYSFLLEAESTLERWSQRKIPLWIKPATSRLVSRFLCATTCYGISQQELVISVVKISNLHLPILLVLTALGSIRTYNIE